MADATLSGSGPTGGGQTGSGDSTRGGALSIGEIANGARAAIDDVKGMGSELFGAARDGANSLFEEQRNRAADEIASFGKALHGSAQSLEQSGQGGGATVARYADQAAGTINDFAETLRHRSVGEMAGDAEKFARQWPMAFMASAIGLGFVAGRFLMSSRPAPVEPAAPQNKSSRAANEPRGGARQDSGAVTGAVSGNAKSGYGAASGEHG